MEKAKGEKQYFSFLIEKKLESEDFYRGLRAAWYFSGIIDCNIAEQMQKAIEAASQN